MIPIRATTRIALAALVSFSLAGCREKKDEKPARQYEKQNMVRAANDVSLPSKLWDLVAQGVGNEQTEFVPIRVHLIEKTRGVLGGRNREITFGQGGGELDLKDYVVGPGSFWFSAELVQKPIENVAEKPAAEGEKKAEGGEKKEEKPAEKKEEKKEGGAAASGPEFKVFYLSQGKERTLDKLTYGAGCDSYFDITSYFTKAAKNDGLLGLVAGERYVSTLSGVYFLSLHEGDRLQLAQVTVRDSRYPALMCPPHE